MSRKVLPLLVLVVAGIIAAIAFFYRPKPMIAEQPEPDPLVVQAISLKAQAFPIQVQSFGKVQPRTQSTLLPQVSGQIIEISPNFRDGGFFEKNELLIRIDNRDYQAQVQIAQANLSEAELALREEQAKAEQAKADWQRLNNGARKAPDLVLRKPQLAAAQARVQSAQAQLDQAKLNLERTQIMAPYAGRILSKHVDVGQVVSPSTNLADIYAIDYLEIRLPVKNHELQFLSLPETLRYHEAASHELPNVRIENRLGDPAEMWPAKLVRTEGAIDEKSHQLYVIAQIDDPFGIAAQGKRPLKIGQYVHALIEGNKIPNALVIPNKAIYQDSYVYTVVDEKLQRTEITIQWQDSQQALLKSGLKTGDILVTTPLGQVTSGTPVRVENLQ